MRGIGAAALLFLAPACRTTAPSLSAREQAQVYLARNQPEAALPLLEALHAEAPDDLTIARQLVEANVKSGRAQKLIDKLTAEKRDDVVTHYMLGLAYYARSADAAGPAVAELQAAIAQAPNEPELHHRLGIALLESEKYEPALVELKRARELAPDRLAVALPLAKALQRTGDAKGAVAELRRVVTGNPTPQEVATARALMDDAADLYGRIPQAARAKWEEGLTWLHDRDVPQPAIVAFEEIAHDYPDLAIVHGMLGLAYQRVDDAGRAVDEYKRAIELDPRQGAYHLWLAELYLARQRGDSAEKELEAALELNPLLDGAWLGVGDLALERRELDAARDAYRVVVALKPDDTGPRGKLAAALQLRGDFPAAEKELLRIADKAPEDVEFMLRLGVLYLDWSKASVKPDERRDLPAKAETWLRKVLDAQPENALASRALETLKGGQ